MFSLLGVFHENMSGCLKESEFKANASIKTVFGHESERIQTSEIRAAGMFAGRICGEAESGCGLAGAFGRGAHSVV